MKILLVEDDLAISELLCATLSQHRYAVDAVADGSVGLELAAQWSYDLILLDILLPSLNGIEVCRQLRAQGCRTPILILTSQDAHEDVVAGLDAGADDYLVKSIAPAQLLARLRALLRRGEPVALPILTWGQLCLDPAQARVTYSQQEIALRPKEYSLLELFLRHSQRVLNRSAIIDHLWPMEEPPVEASVTNLIKDLRQRLKAAGMVDPLIETVYGLGYRLKAAPISAPVSAPTAVQPAAETAAASSPEQRGRMAIQQIGERFQLSLEQRMSQLEAALRQPARSATQRQAAQSEAHKLAGGLGTFGHRKASELARSIEQLFAMQESQEAQFSSQLTELLQELKQELAKPLAATSNAIKD